MLHALRCIEVPFGTEGVTTIYPILGGHRKEIRDGNNKTVR